MRDAAVAVAPKFKGTVDQKIDAKGRVSVPAALRKVAEQCDPDFKSGDKDSKGTPATICVVFQPDAMDFLECYSVEGMAEIDSYIDALDIGSPERDGLEFRYHANVTLAEIDGDGRIVIPLAHRTRLGFDGDARFIGLGDRFEIWNPATYGARGASPVQALAETYGKDFNIRAMLQRKRAE